MAVVPGRTRVGMMTLMKSYDNMKKKKKKKKKRKNTMVVPILKPKTTAKQYAIALSSEVGGGFRVFVCVWTFFRMTSRGWSGLSVNSQVPLERKKKKRRDTASIHATHLNLASVVARARAREGGDPVFIPP